VLTALAARTDKPTVVYTYTEPAALARQVLRQLRLPLYVGIASCARGMAALAHAGEVRDEPDVPIDPTALAAARAAIASCADGVLCEYEAKAALRAFGLAVSREALATTAAEAVAIAADIGRPVALKVQSPDVPHKVAAGAVALGCRTVDDVEDAFARVVNATRANAPGAHLHGVLVQEMAPTGFEVLIGVENRSGLGPIVLIGLGGELVEVLNRTVAYPAPFGLPTAHRLVAELGIDRVVTDVGPLAQLASDVSQLAAAASDLIAELDLNPVIVERASGRPHIVDALIARD
jgi:acyl-CoA synthetase (NDP forming)